MPDGRDDVDGAAVEIIELMEEQARADEMSGKVWASLKSYIEKVRASTAVGSQYLVTHRGFIPTTRVVRRSPVE